MQWEQVYKIFDTNKMGNSDDIDRACEELTAFVGNRNEDAVHYHRHSHKRLFGHHGAAKYSCTTRLE